VKKSVRCSSCLLSSELVGQKANKEVILLFTYPFVMEIYLQSILPRRRSKIIGFKIHRHFIVFIDTIDLHHNIRFA
jgi:hypothetical protein